MRRGLDHPVGASKAAEAPEKVIGEILAGIRTLHRWSRQKSGVSKAAVHLERLSKLQKAALMERLKTATCEVINVHPQCVVK